jgi:hypothetical protein
MGVEIHPHRGKPEVRAANTHLLRTALRPFPKCLLERVFEQNQRYTVLTASQVLRRQ